MPVIKKIQPTVPTLKRRKRVAAYARVSDDYLLHSLSAQVSYFSSYIQSNPEWEYAGVYSDEAISGTSRKKRNDFNRLVEDCESGLIDMVLVKSISRFARDTVDTLLVTRRLKELGIDVYFERERIHSMSEEGELLLTLLASFAQEESRSISENVKWGIRKRFKEGIPNGHKAPYGYRWDGEMFRIIEEQGQVVKDIYKRYLAGEPAYSIAKGLAADGVVGQTGVPMDDSTIKNILTSISYTGTMILQKNFINENHVRKYNKGELPQYAVEEMFEPLVTVEDFVKVQHIKAERAEAMPNKDYQKTAFSGIVKCGCCGCSVSRRTTKFGKKWNCNTRERKGKAVCEFRPIYETELMDAATIVLGLDSFDENAVRRKVEQITIHLDRIEFHMNNGSVKKVWRAYKKGYSGFSGKLTCGCCGGNYERDTWRMGPAGQKEKVKVWVCRECSARRVLDDELRLAAENILQSKDYEPLFASTIEEMMVYDDRFEFYDKERTVRIWQRK